MLQLFQKNNAGFCFLQGETKEDENIVTTLQNINEEDQPFTKKVR